LPKGRKPWVSSVTKQPAPKGRKKVAQTCGNVVVHLIFSTKQRKPLIGADVRLYLFAYLGGIVRELRGTALIINGTGDHVHMLIRIRPAHSIAEIARIVKTNSSGWMRKNGHKEFAWQSGYGVFSVSESNIPALTKYIATQEEHHRKRSFQEEFVAFLQKNKVAYDERYIWN
jgi:REP element-mobilizing transposase RayT